MPKPKSTPSPSAAPLPGIFARFASLAPATYSEADQSVEVVFTTGAAVHRIDPWTGDEFDEVLTVEPGAVRLDRLNAGAPVLDSHDRARGLAGVVGTVVPGSAAIAGGEGRCRIRLASTPDVADVVAKVAEGVIRNVSIGYLVHRSELRDPGDAGGRKQLVALEWEPVEVSLVAIPADPGAQLRDHPGAPLAGFYVAQAPTGAGVMLPPLPAGRERSLGDFGRPDRAIGAAALRRLCQHAGMPAEDLAELLVRHADSPLSEAEGHQVMNSFIAANRPLISNRVAVTVDAGDTARAGIEEALYCRLGGRRPENAGAPYRGLPLMALAREWLGQRGLVDRLAGDAEILERALHTSSDFPRIMAGAGNRFLLDAYGAAESGIKRVAAIRRVRDFRPINVFGVATTQPLAQVGEGGEVRYGSVGESGEVYRLGTFAQIIGISRQMIVNDDIGAFASPLTLYGRGTAETEATLLAGILNANAGAGANMADGNPLYNVQWANRAVSGSVISVAALGDARAALRNARDLKGDPDVPSNAVPRTLLVPAALETVAQQFVAQITPAAPASANPFAGVLDVATDPRLTGTGWRLFADPALFPVIELAYLDGAEGPRLEMRDGWTTLGIEFRVTLDVGAAPVSRVGSYWNPGA